LETRLGTTGVFGLKKSLNQHNRCKDFKVTKFWLFNVDIMLEKMHPNEAFVEVEGCKWDNMSHTYLLLGFQNSQSFLYTIMSRFM
jgi:hypothetical protein